MKALPPFQLFCFALLGLVFYVGFSVSPVSSQDETFSLPEKFTYRFLLNYDGRRLQIVPQNESRWRMLVKDFQNPNPATHLFYGQVMSFRNEVLSKFHFQLALGENEVEAPHFPNNRLIRFFSSQGALLLELDVQDSASCNENNMCQKDRGENPLNCPYDCNGSKPAPGATTSIATQPSPFAPLNPPLSQPLSQKTHLALLVVGILIAAGVIGFFIAKLVHRR